MRVGELLYFQYCTQYCSKEGLKSLPSLIHTSFFEAKIASLSLAVPLAECLIHLRSNCMRQIIINNMYCNKSFTVFVF